LDDARGGLLPGERLLWSGGPGRIPISPADGAFCLYLLGALAAVAITAHGFLHHASALFVAVAVVVWGAGAVGAVATLINLLVLTPVIRRRSAYQVTDYRVVVTTGLRRCRTWSAYLDQIDEPAVVRHRDGTEDLLLRARPGSAFSSMLAGAHGESPFRLGMPPDFPVLRSLTNAAQAQQVVAAARRRMRAGMLDVPPEAGLDATAPLPAAIGLAAGERVLWSGRPERAPWWFGREDIYYSLFGLVCLVFAGLMGALVVTAGSAASVAVLVPFAAAGGLYPSVGRVIYRRVRIRRSTYAVTDQRLIAVWQIRGEPVVVQTHLRWLLPPVISGQAILTSMARTDDLPRQGGWKSLTWPAATTRPPVLVGIRDPQSVRDLICAAQLAMRATNPARARTNPASLIGRRM
jgi:hypothetical protein